MDKKEFKKSLYNRAYLRIIIEQLHRPLTNEELEILILRYIKNQSWDYIAIHLHISRTTAYRIESQLLDDLIRANKI